jgi:hypothetical protein
MPLALVQELDANFLAIKKWKELRHTARKLEERLEALNKSKLKHQVEKEPKDFIDEIENGYTKAVLTIHGYLHVPFLCAIIAKLLDFASWPPPMETHHRFLCHPNYFYCGEQAKTYDTGHHGNDTLNYAGHGFW